MKQKNLIGILLIAVFVVVTGIIFGTGQERGESSRMLESAAITDTQDTGETEKQKETETETETKASEQASQIYVYVCGHVKEPGVVRITSGQRVYEAIAKGDAEAAERAMCEHVKNAATRIREE